MMTPMMELAQALLLRASSGHQALQAYEAHELSESLVAGWAAFADWTQAELHARKLLESEFGSHRAIGIAAWYRFAGHGLDEARQWLAVLQAPVWPFLQELLEREEGEAAHALVADVLADESLRKETHASVVDHLLRADLRAQDHALATKTAELAPDSASRTSSRLLVVRSLAASGDIAAAEKLGRKIRKARTRSLIQRYIGEARADQGQLEQAAADSDSVEDLRQRMLLRAHIAQHHVRLGALNAAFELNAREAPHERTDSHRTVVSAAIAEAIAEHGDATAALDFVAAHTGYDHAEHDRRVLTEAVALGHLSAGRVDEAARLLPDLGDSLTKARHLVAEGLARAGSLDDALSTLRADSTDPRWQTFLSALLESETSPEIIIERLSQLAEWRRDAALFKLTELLAARDSPFAAWAARAIHDDKKRLQALRLYVVPAWVRLGDLESPAEAFPVGERLQHLESAGLWLEALLRAGKDDTALSDRLAGTTLKRVMAGAARRLCDESE